MADIADIAHEREEQLRNEALEKRPPAEIPEGKAGECDFCGEWSSRLIGGACAPCRDARRLP